jgi:hypothetical protein
MDVCEWVFCAKNWQLRPPVLDNTSLDQVWRKLCLAYYGIDPGLSRSSDSNDQSLPGNGKEGQQ